MLTISWTEKITNEEEKNRWRKIYLKKNTAEETYLAGARITSRWHAANNFGGKNNGQKR